MGNNKLTKSKFLEIRSDAEGIYMLSDEQVAAMAVKLNEKVNLPIIGEKLEEVVFAKIIRKIDSELYKLVPNEYYQLIKISSDGISDEDAEVFKSRLTPLINEKVNIPILSERRERKMIEFVLDTIIDAMRKNFKLEEKPLVDQ
jgi:hypothetical protein